MALAVCGPTAVGKSAAAARAAARIGGEIVNADSRQIYAGMPIGTGWPSREIMALAPHHGYGLICPAERYSAGRFVADATRTIAEISARGHVAIVVGGTGLYLEALAGSMPLDRSVADEAIKQRVQSEAALHRQSTLHAWLASLSPPAAARVPAGDSYRTLRALEAALADRDGRKFADRPALAVELRVLVIDCERSILGARIARRIEAMFESGIIEEARAIRERHADAPALTGLGYAEALAYYDGALTRSEALRAAIARTQRYAKRQQTWFRRMRGAHAIDATHLAIDDLAEAIASEARKLSAPA